MNSDREQLASLGQPSELAKRVEAGFQQSAQSEVSTHIARGEPVVAWTQNAIAQIDFDSQLIGKSLRTTTDAMQYHEGQVIKDAITGTIKTDGGKNRLDLLPVRALEQVAQVLTAGLEKYPGSQWTAGMAWSRPYASALRHLFAWWRGEDLDPQTGLSHLAHCACNLLFLLEYQSKSKGTDDRTK